MAISAFITSIPDVIWSGVIASVLTLSGVLISNWSNSNRHKAQLKHDSDEKAKERKANLRREVYLLAAEELVKANNHLGKLPQLDITKSNPADGLQGFFAAAAKLQLVSEPKTSLLVSELVTTYGELVLKAISKTLPIQELRVDIAIRDDHYNRAQAEVSRILATMTQFNESAQTDAIAFAALQRSFEFHQGQATIIASEREGLWKQQNSLHITFVKELLTEMKVIGEQQVPVMVEIRRELDLAGDADEFLQQMNNQWKRISSQLDAVLYELEIT